jgi:hypothetical protein
MLRPTVSRSVSLGIKHLSGARDKIIISVKTVAGLLMWGALSHERVGLPFTVAAGPRQRSHLGSESPGNHYHFLLSQIRDSHNLEVQVPVFISHTSSVAQLYPQALGSLFVAPVTRRATVWGIDRLRVIRSYVHIKI